MSMDIYSNTDGVVVSEDGNSWEYTISNLPVYYEGKAITYEAKEDTTDTKVFNETGYQLSSTSGNASSGYTFTNTHEPEKVNIDITKVWEDDDNRDGKRKTITIILNADGEPAVDASGKAITKECSSSNATSDDPNTWSCGFTDLPKNNQGKEILYTIDEIEIDGYKSTISGDFKNGFEIKNEHTPILVNIEGIKKWQDGGNTQGLRPTTLTIHLLKNGKRLEQDVTATATADGNWAFKFEDLYAYENGSKIVYTVEEDEVELYTPSDPVYNEDHTKVEITNTHEPINVTIEGLKTWDHTGNEFGTPTSITVRLTGTILVDEKAKEVVTDSKTVTEADGWKYSFTYPEYIEGKKVTYTITEDDITDYVPTYDGYNIKNKYTPATTEIEGFKAWDDADNQDGKRPTSITVRLIGMVGDNEVVNIPQTIDADSNWSFKFTGVKVYANGEEISYSIKEDEVEGYDFSEVENTWDIKNTHTPETVNFEITKVWEDDDNSDELRPDHVTVVLTASILNDQEEYVVIDSQTKTVDITANGKWSYKFENLPKYNSGKEIKYTITEEEVSNYLTTYSDQAIVDNNITQIIYNTQEVTISGNKIWDDNDDQDGIRPATVTVQLYKNGEAVEGEDGIRELSADTDWYYEFDNLIMYENHEKVEYSVKEILSDVITEEDTENGHYASETISEEKYVVDIKNTHTPETVTIDITKSWADHENEDKIRPSEIIVHILKNGVEFKEVKLNEANGWYLEVSGLDKYEAGKEIVYSVVEQEIDFYNPTYRNEKYSFYIINTHEPEKGDTTIIDPPPTGITYTNTAEIYNYNNVMYIDDRKKKLFRR